MVRVRFPHLGAEAEIRGERWRVFKYPALFGYLQDLTNVSMITDPDFEIGAARLACRALGGTVVSMSYPRPRVRGSRRA